MLVLNSGSSSLRFQVIDKKSLKCLYKGHIDRVKNSREALSLALNTLIKKGILKSKSEISSVGHRVVHGGEKYIKPTLINKTVLADLQKLSSLAPLHNKANIDGIIASQKLLPKIPQIAVFDTAFHNTMPEKAYLYAVPYDWYKKYEIRRYGFHGTSHKYISNEASAYLKKKHKKSDKMITCHLGNGCSITAIHKGKSIDTSMGFTPLEGIPMGSRSGNIDPAIIFYLARNKKMSLAEIEKILEKESGFKGLSGIGSDIRDILKAYKKGDKRAKLTFSIFAYQIAKYIGAYSAAMNGLDCIVFTGGIGENAWYIRKEVCDYLKFLGVELSSLKNKNASELKNPEIRKISSPKSRVSILVIPTNEELQITKEAKSRL